MKKIIFTVALTLSAFIAKPQAVIDTVSIGAGYANQVWYSLPNDNQGSALKNNWDIAFDCSGMGSAIMINSITGTTLWKYPKSDTTNWGNIDTTGITTWTKHYNADTSWSEGAIGRYTNANNPYDLDWGVYSMITHYVTGDSIYIIKLANNQYKKLWIVELANGAYTFKYADFNGNNLQNATLTKSIYSIKNFGYYSLQNNAALDREPASAAWDLVFTQYTTFIPSAYTVTGVLQNKGVHVAKIDHLANPATYNNYASQPFASAINTIGYDWKTYNGSYVVNDSSVYFVKPASGNIWRLIFTGFGGSANGNFIFSKENLSTTSINDVKGNNLASLTIYPNPSEGNNINIVYDLASNVNNTQLFITDMSGRNLYTQKLNSNIGLNTLNISSLDLSAGMYIINVTVDKQNMQQKLIVK